jgi:hypothetical protein
MGTTNPFERHGIDHLSPSSLRLWRDCPSVWIGKYMLRAPDDSGPGAWRGHAVEVGVDRMLFGMAGGLPDIAMHEAFETLAQGLADDDVEKERKALPDFYLQARIAFDGKPVPLQRQAKMTLMLPGIEVPLVGFADWLWPEYGVDLKTTWRMPNGGKPDPSHVDQVAAYSMFHGVPFHLTYVTPKRWTTFEVTRDEAAEGYERTIEAAQAVRSLLNRVDGAHDALSMFSPDYDDYHFRPAMVEAVKAAKAVRSIRAAQ